jgi:hypothetical protein
VTWSSRPRAVLHAGALVADPGPALDVDADPEVIDGLAQRWTEAGRRHAGRAADAQLARTDHDREVAPAMKAAQVAAGNADQAERAADGAAQEAARATAAANLTAQELLDQIASWQSHQDEAWSPTEIADLRSAEPGQVQSQTEQWRDGVRNRADEECVRLGVELAAVRQRSADLAERAVALRADAQRLRAGELLALPRPAWLDDTGEPRVDDAALAAALEWAPSLTSPRERALIETALASVGLLAARLDTEGATTSAWRVHPTGPEVPQNLATALAVDPAHPLAATAAAVLARIALVPSADLDHSDDQSAMVIGRDGTFRAGPLYGRAPGADDETKLPAAQHVGAVQRRAAALLRAEALEREAAQLDAERARADADADALSAQSQLVRGRADAFPSGTALSVAEGARAGAALRARQLHAVAAEARVTADTATARAAEVRTEWAGRTTARGLPTDLDELAALHAESARRAEALAAAATELRTRLRRRVERLLVDLDRLQKLATALPQVRATAQTAHEDASALAEQVRTLRELSGAAAQQALDEHAAARREQSALRGQEAGARAAVETASLNVGSCSTAPEHAETAAGQAEPTAAAAARDLVRLLEVTGVRDVLDLLHLSLDDTDSVVILEVVGAALEGRRTSERNALRTRYDQARAALAGVWALDPAESHGALDTFVLTHDDVAYSPPAAERRAAELKDRARAALDAAEESALRDFVVGRLPSAIGTAWVRLHDWTRDVNSKMRSARASSGVGVQVRARLAEGLSPAVRTVHELACKVADADRSREQQTQVGAALQQLIAAAPGETMAERLAAAVDVRDWVDVHYEVTRAEGVSQRWTSRTGLSSGERRLVVLAPMIAAVAAAYDGLATTGLRLAALDEVPAEVDEHGREGLARFLAELDLDLICTSHLWDGAPGAWDGIDAHDLEAGADGTVVAFPMQLRGLFELPGDEPFDAPRPGS